MRAIGMAERALKQMCKRSQERVMFGKSLSEQGVMRERIANARILIDQSRLLVLNAADKMDRLGNKEARKEIAMIKEDDLPPPASAGVVGGVPGGVPGGTAAGVLGGIMGGVPTAAPPPPPPVKKEPEKPKLERIRVGGNVQAANLVRKVTPVYPPLAKQARVQGTVRFTAIIGRDGAIQNLQLVSGHPLLVPAATEAVKQWVYRPTMLNGEPVEVITQIDVNFTLSS